MEGVGGSLSRSPSRAKAQWTGPTRAGESFAVPANSSFEIACDEAYHYVCHFG
jgi:uncharacterized protein YaiE (UPF0345 family)